MPHVFASVLSRALGPGLVIVLCTSAVGHASRVPVGGTCGNDLGANAAIAIFPWPTPPPELITAMLRHVGDGTDATSVELRRLLERPSPNAIIRDLFLPFSATEVRRYYGPNAVTPPDMHAIRYDLTGHRQLIARGVAAIADRRRQAEWIDFMKHDVDGAVRLRIASAFLSWPERRDRDAVVESELERPRPDKYILRAALNMSHVISPGVRWRLIRRLTRGVSTDTAIVKAMRAFPEHDVMRAWYDDQLVVNGLKRALDDYDPSLKAVKHRHEDLPGLTFSAHEFAAYDYAFDLTTLNADHLRTAQLRTLVTVERRGDERAEFVRDVLSWAETQEILRNYALARQSIYFEEHVERTLTLDKLRAATGGNAVRLAWATHLLEGNERDFTTGRRVPERINWDEGTLTDLARTLARRSEPAE